MTIFRSILLCYVVLTLCSAITTTTTLSAAEDSSSSITLGTTIVAVQFDAGVIVAADTRTSQQGTFVSHRWATKIAAVAPLVTVARDGSAAATQHVLEAWERSSSSSSSSSTCVDVTHVAHWFRRHVRDDSNNNEKRSFLIAGMEQQKRSNTTIIPRIYSLSASGALVREDHVRYACNGSGSSFAMAYLHEHIITNDELLDETTALEHCRRAIEHAAYRDPSSGGCLRYRIVRTNGTSTHGTLPLLRRVAASSSTTNTKDDALPGFAAPVRRPFPMVTKSKSVV